MDARMVSSEHIAIIVRHVVTSGMRVDDDLNIVH